MTICKGSFAFSSCVALLAFSRLAVGALEYKLSSPQIAPGEHASVEVRLKVRPQPGGAEPEQPTIQDDLLTQSQDFQILEREFRRDGDEWVWHYEITAYKPGQVRLPPVEI